MMEGGEQQSEKLVFNSTTIIGNVEAEFAAMKQHHDLDWNSYYEGWTVGRMDLAQHCNRRIKELNLQLYTLIRALKTKELTEQQKAQIAATEAYMQRHFDITDVLR